MKHNTEIQGFRPDKGDDTQMLHLIFIISSQVADKIVFSK
jgi:hypothetical protein